MSLKFTLRQNKIRGGKGYGKWYAHTLRGSELTLDEIEQRIQASCSVTRADVRAVVTALQDVVADGLKSGHVVSLGELGKFYLSIRSESVDSPDDFCVKDHVKGVECNYIPLGHRNQLSHRIVRPFTEDCRVEQVSVYDETGHIGKRVRRGGKVRRK
jgi:predicted histone-like DNA-binding protein